MMGGVDANAQMMGGHEGRVPETLFGATLAVQHVRGWSGACAGWGMCRAIPLARDRAFGLCLEYVEPRFLNRTYRTGVVPRNP